MRSRACRHPRDDRQSAQGRAGRLLSSVTRRVVRGARSRLLPRLLRLPRPGRPTCTYLRSSRCWRRACPRAAFQVSAMSPRRAGRRLFCNPFEHRTWVAIQQWCHEPSHPRFPRYGGLGVVVADRWRECFANFVQDMGGYGTRPRRTVLARRDRSGPFSPSNCYWRTQ